MFNEFDSQIGKGSQQLHTQMMAESGLEMHWIGALIGAVGGAVASGIGAQAQQDAYNEQVKINYEMAKETWQYENEQADRQVAFAKEGIAIQNKNNIRNARWQDATNLKNWKQTVAEGDFKYLNQLMAKMESDRTLQENLAFNAEATDHALAQQDNWLQDRFQEREFSLMDQELAMSKAEDEMTRSFNDILITAAKQRSDIFGAMTKTQFDAHTQRMELSFKKQDNEINKLLESGKAQNLQAGRSGDKAIQSAEAAGGRKAAEFNEMATQVFKIAALNMHQFNNDLLFVNMDAKNRKEAVGKEYLAKAKSVNLDQFKTWESWRSARRQDHFQRDDIWLSRKQADMTARAQNMAMPFRGPVPPPPFATPLPDLQEPMEHVWSPKPKKGATQSGAVWGAVGGALSGIGGALDAGAKAGWK